MRAEKTSSSKGELTRQHVLDSALELFRRRGYDATSMRDIAQAAELSLGAAYHYFPSKEALVAAYYEWMQDEHERKADAEIPPGANFATKLKTLLETKLELFRRDRKILAALFQNLANPSSPLSVFGRQGQALRTRSIAQFEAVFSELSTSPELKALLAQTLWLAHLGIFLVFIYDTTPRQARTYKLIDALIDLTSWGVPLLLNPLAAPLRRKILARMRELEFTN